MTCIWGIIGISTFCGAFTHVLFLQIFYISIGGMHFTNRLRHQPVNCPCVCARLTAPTPTAVSNGDHFYASGLCSPWSRLIILLVPNMWPDRSVDENPKCAYPSHLGAVNKSVLFLFIINRQNTYNLCSSVWRLIRRTSYNKKEKNSRFWWSHGTTRAPCVY